jgi:FKBP-type peptidyl-prolyl cis-trans isomerase
MRRLMFAVAISCLVLTGPVRSQDTLPQNQADNQSQPAARAAFGRPAAPAQGNAAGDAVDRQQVSYGLGRNFAMNLRENEIDVDYNALMAGISDALRGAQPKWSDQELEATMKRFEQGLQQKAMMRVQQMAAKNKQEAATFFAQNGRQPGVQTTASGLQYRVLRPGNGPSPTLNDRVKCNYRGTLLNGTEFDSSARNGGPAEFGVNEVIDGWKEALQKMHVGEKWQLFVPPNLAYDMHPPRPPIEPGHMLVFEIELVDILK